MATFKDYIPIFERYIQGRMETMEFVLAFLHIWRHYVKSEYHEIEHTLYELFFLVEDVNEMPPGGGVIVTEDDLKAALTKALPLLKDGLKKQQKENE